MVLEELTIDNPNAAKTIVYRGIKEIIPAWESYYKDYGDAVNNSFLSEEDCIWAEENTFRILISLKTNELVAVRDFGMYHPTTVDFLFRTEYLPLFTHQPESAEALEARAKETVDQFYMETQEMLNRHAKPLFLVEHLGTNNYLAWSLAENKYLFVYGFKTYRENFRISEIDTKTPNSITDNNEYSILPPSRKLIKMISSFDSQLSPEIWENKMRWDVWEARPEKIPIDLHDTSYTNLYNEAIAVINLGRKEDLGYDNDFASLESRVRRFEDLNTMGFPAMLMEKETELIKESMETIKAKLK